MSYKTCIDCGEFYYASEPWKVRCVGCWRERKRSEPIDIEKRRLAEWSIALEKWESELEEREARLIVRESEA